VINKLILKPDKTIEPTTSVGFLTSWPDGPGNIFAKLYLSASDKGSFSHAQLFAHLYFRIAISYKSKANHC